MDLGAIRKMAFSQIRRILRKIGSRVVTIKLDTQDTITDRFSLAEYNCKNKRALTSRRRGRGAAIAEAAKKTQV